MFDAIFNLTIRLLIGLGTALIMVLWFNKIETMRKELDYFYVSDTTMLIEGDTLPRQFLIEE